MRLKEISGGENSEVNWLPMCVGLCVRSWVLIVIKGYTLSEHPALMSITMTYRDTNCYDCRVNRMPQSHKWRRLDSHGKLPQNDILNRISLILEGGKSFPRSMRHVYVRQAQCPLSHLFIQSFLYSLLIYSSGSTMCQAQWRQIKRGRCQDMKFQLYPD